MAIPNDQTIIREIDTVLRQAHLKKYVVSMEVEHLPEHSQINYKLIDSVKKIRSMKEQVLNTISEVSGRYDITVLNEV